MVDHGIMERKHGTMNLILSRDHSRRGSTLGCGTFTTHSNPPRTIVIDNQGVTTPLNFLASKPGPGI
jgi:hypothetical protein